MKRLALLAAIVGLFSVSAVADPQCWEDHWNPACAGGAPSPYGAPYFSCYSYGSEYCCKYRTQNHHCLYPPPDPAKFFWLIGFASGPCHSNAYGQWCDDMPEPAPT
jgi:hypothetical protein